MLFDNIVGRDTPTNAIRPIPYRKKPVTKLVCTFDTETDPFAEGRIVQPFSCGFHIVPCGSYPDGAYWDFWGDDCIDQFFTFLQANFSEVECLIYVHNGGNFDFYFCVDHFDEGMEPFIINGRLTRVYMGGHEFRDSYSAIPVALSVYKKDDIDYTKLERPVRELHKAEILSYQKADCVYLGQLIRRWLDEFGDKLTMASAALPMLRSYHGFEDITEAVDDLIRPYYFGGRVQCFETGIIEDNWIIVDVHNMYPSVMKDCLHPVSADPIEGTEIDDNTMFAHIRARSDGALPKRALDGSLFFPVGEDEFFACIHEIRAGIECGLLEVLETYKTYSYASLTSFGTFVDTFYNLRLEAKDSGDGIGFIFYKLVPNSSYGKLAQDSRNYETYLFDPVEPPDPAKGWYSHTVRGGKVIYAKGQDKDKAAKFFNVATAASITSAARAKLLRGIASSERPIYCDTDSIICKKFGGEIHERTLGTWGIEATGNVACIAGKKLYAVFNNSEPIKKASKGVKLTAEEIQRVANGEVIVYSNPVPKFSLLGKPDRNTIHVNEMVDANFVVRTVRMTGNAND